MTDFRAILSNLRRPRLLIRAARFGMIDYHRERDLKRILGTPGPAERTMTELLAEEDRLEQVRCRGDASYIVSRHIEVLVALMAEVRLLPRDMVR
jgi:hypothetical protein